MVARYNAGGSPDTSFGTGAVSLVPLGDDGTAEANAVVLEGNCAVVTGDASDGGVNKSALAALTLADPATPCGGLPGRPAPDTTPPTLSASLKNKRFRVGKGTSLFGARKKRAPAWYASATPSAPATPAAIGGCVGVRGRGSGAGRVRSRSPRCRRRQRSATRRNCQ